MKGGAAYGSAYHKMSTLNGGGHFFNQMEMTTMDQGMARHFGTMRDGFSTCDSGMALDEYFLNDYYTNVSGAVLETTPIKKKHNNAQTPGLQGNITTYICLFKDNVGQKLYVCC